MTGKSQVPDKAEGQGKGPFMRKVELEEKNNHKNSKPALAGGSSPT